MFWSSEKEVADHSCYWEVVEQYVIWDSVQNQQELMGRSCLPWSWEEMQFSWKAKSAWDVFEGFLYLAFPAKPYCELVRCRARAAHLPNADSCSHTACSRSVSFMVFYLFLVDHFDILLEKWELQDRWVLAILQIGNRVTSPVHVGPENLILRAGPRSPALSLLQLLKFLWAASNLLSQSFFPRWSFTAHSLVLSKPSHVGNGWMKTKEMVS